MDLCLATFHFNVGVLVFFVEKKFKFKYILFIRWSKMRLFLQGYVQTSFLTKCIIVIGDFIITKPP